MAEFGSRWSRETQLAQEESDRALNIPRYGVKPADELQPATPEGELGFIPEGPGGRAWRVNYPCAANYAAHSNTVGC